MLSSLLAKKANKWLILTPSGYCRCLESFLCCDVIQNDDIYVHEWSFFGHFMAIYGPVAASTVPVTTTGFKAAFLAIKLYEDF